MKKIVLGGAFVLGILAAALGDAGAQRLDPRRPSLLVVGAPGGPSPMQRVDARRTGLAKDSLPASQLRVAWRRSVSLSIDQPPVVGSDGSLAVVTSRGDVLFLDGDGEEKGHVTVDGRSAGPAAVTSDGTIVFATSGGDAVGVTRSSTRPRFVNRIGGERNVKAAPLALDDGGAVIATLTDLVAIDSEGSVRSRTTLPERPDAPLLVSGDKVISISPTGTVYGWVPGREAVRLGSFGAQIDNGAALYGASSLVAVIEGNHLVELDLKTGTRSSRAIAPAGLYLGPPALRPNGSVSVLGMTPTRLVVATIDTAGQESLRAPIGSYSTTPLADGGAPPLVAPPHAGVLVDARGAIAYASTEGKVGVISPEGAVEALNELPCSRSSRSSGIAGLTPWGKGAFVLACEGGNLVKIVGPEGASSAPAPRPESSSLRPKPAPSAGTGDSPLSR